MGQEIDLLVNYPKAKRNLEERAASKTEADRAIARKFGQEFFDGDLTISPNFGSLLSQLFKNIGSLIKVAQF
jgi:hypothetical protein